MDNIFIGNFFFSKDIKFKNEKNLVLILIVIFYFFILISSLSSEYFKKSILTSIPYLRFIIFALVIKFLLIKKNFFNKNLYQFYFYVILLVCIDAWFQYIFGKNILNFSQVTENRISGFFGEKLILGSFLCKIYPLILIIYVLNINNLNKLEKLFFYIFSLVLSSTIFISGERAALNHHLIFLMIVFFLIFDFSKKNFSFLIIGVSMFIVIITTNNNAFNRQINSQYQNFKSNNIFTVYHSQHFTAAFKIFKDNKYFGTGVKTFRYECRKPKYKESNAQRLKGIKSCSTHPHNTYLQILSESGFFAFICIFVIFIFFFFKLVYFFYLKLSNRLKIEHQPLIIISAFFFFYLLPLSTNGNFFNNWLNSIFFLYLGVYLFLSERLNLNNK